MSNVVVMKMIHDGFANSQDREAGIYGSLESKLGLEEVDGGDRIKDFRCVEPRLGGVFLDLFFFAEWMDVHSVAKILHCILRY